MASEVQALGEHGKAASGSAVAGIQIPVCLRDPRGTPGGVLGLVFGGTGFEAGSDVQGDDFIIFEVNGWHNVVHIATGAFLVLMSTRAAAAATAALIFGVVYTAIAVWGFVDGNDVVNLVATDTADNWLHVGLAATGVLVGVLA